MKEYFKLFNSKRIDKNICFIEKNLKSVQLVQIIENLTSF